MKKLALVSVAALFACASAPAFAAPVAMSDAEMASVVAGESAAGNCNDTLCAGRIDFGGATVNGVIRIGDNGTISLAGRGSIDGAAAFSGHIGLNLNGQVLAPVPGNEGVNGNCNDNNNVCAGRINVGFLSANGNLRETNSGGLAASGHGVLGDVATVSGHLTVDNLGGIFLPL
jgi:hypothetical protein